MFERPCRLLSLDTKCISDASLPRAPDRLSQIRPAQRRIVPIGPNITSPTDRAQLFVLNARRLEVLRNCINFIFENKISDARKVSGNAIYIQLRQLGKEMFRRCAVVR